MNRALERNLTFDNDSDHENFTN